MSTASVVIVGTSAAGVSAATTLRTEGYDGRVVLLGEEVVPPYDRPLLSKGYLAGTVTADDLNLRPDGFWADREIDLRLGSRVVALRASDTSVLLDDGSSVKADAVILATGGRSRALPVPGAELDGIFGLRTRADSESLRDWSAGAEHAVIVGMGFIGAEVAATLRSRGVAVTIVEPLSTPLERVLGEQVGNVVGALHAENGVEMIFGDGVVGFDGANGRVTEVATTSGRRLRADVVVVGVGMVPDTAVVTGTQVAVDNGILVDEHARTTVPNVYAVGDVAHHSHPFYGRRLRTEHWTHAVDHGAVAARSVLGRGDPYSTIPWVWSDQYDLALQYAGMHTGWDRLAVRGNLAGRDALAFYMRDGVPVAAVTLNRNREMRRAMAILRRGQPVDADLLADEAIDLREFAA
ncbi:FAD-dependent oxidoreductase [Microbacterium sp.]|uniref:NAD(P)/FAD-dependent oxidoreductase n=1 Tax=Microbacterium sp. TaxID=51671 RepID=UPI0025D4B13B|nr:FAD-dependent oxidoreductase [Microbacterium sp.]